MVEHALSLVCVTALHSGKDLLVSKVQPPLTYPTPIQVQMDGLHTVLMLYTRTGQTLLKQTIKDLIIIS